MRVSLVFFFTAAMAAAEPAMTWHQDDNRVLELRGASGPVVRFNLASAPQDPRFEVLATADGRNTVWINPPDHVWHYGVWFSWKFINGVNFWETDAPGGRQAGISEIVDPKIESKPDAATAIIRYRDLSRLTENAAPVLEDRVVIRVTRPADGCGPRVDWQMTTTALADVELGRTPPPGEEGGVSWGGYGGFSWRGAKGFKDLHFTDSEGRQDMALHRQHARWLNANGKLADLAAGVAVFDHPKNPGHPASWYLFADGREGNPNPFWYMNPALLQPKPIALKKGQSFIHRYRLVVHSGTWQAAECVKEAESFAAEPPLPAQAP